MQRRRLVGMAGAEASQNAWPAWRLDGSSRRTWGLAIPPSRLLRADKVTG